jgi:hypothetical protein
MAQMSTRIHDLEDALSILQSSISAEPHPLLSSADTERPRSPIPVTSVHEPSVPSIESPDELTAALGSLAIRPFGDSQFHGETASSEVSNLSIFHVLFLSNVYIVLVRSRWFLMLHR